MAGAGLRGRRVRRGGVIVELAVLSPLMVLILFALVELGLELRAATQLNSMAREAVRAAAAGDSTAACWARIQDSGAGLDMSELSMEIEQAEYLGNGQWSQTWTTMEDAGSINAAPLRAMLRVRLVYNHKLFMPRLFSQMVDDAANGTMELNMTTTMVRS